MKASFITTHPNASNEPIAQTSIEKVTGRTSRQVQDQLAIEEPLEIQITYGPSHSRQSKSISITMRTPGNDFELAAGFLATEGVIQNVIDIEDIAFANHSVSESTQFPPFVDAAKPGSHQNIVRVTLAPHVTVSLASLQRNFYTTSSCGICGKASLLALRTACPPLATNDFRVDAQMLYSLPERLASRRASLTVQEACMALVSSRGQEFVGAPRRCGPSQRVG